MYVAFSSLMIFLLIVGIKAHWFKITSVVFGFILGLALAAGPIGSPVLNACQNGAQAVAAALNGVGGGK